MKLDGKNKHKSQIHDWYNRNGFDLFGVVGGGGGGNSEKFEKWGIFNLRTGDRDLNEILGLEGYRVLELLF